MDEVREVSGDVTGEDPSEDGGVAVETRIVGWQPDAAGDAGEHKAQTCLLYTSPSPRDS